MAKHIRNHILSALVFSSLVASSCAKEEESLYIVHMLPIDEEECSAAPGNESLAWGIVDLSFDTGYVMMAQIRNNLAESDNKSSNTGINDSEISLKNVDIRLSIPQDPELIDAVAAIDPSLTEFNNAMSSDSIEGQGDRAVAIRLPNASLEALRMAITNKYGADSNLRVGLLISMVVHGLRTGNELGGGIGRIDAREFEFPIDICMNCLRDCSGCVDGAVCEDTRVGGGGICGNAQDRVTFAPGCVTEE